MYIKQVIIQGFRSYRDQTIVDPFSPRHNVIVGRNGSGKSNFFFAIQFVLSDEFSHMGSEERQQLLHEGAGPRVMSAFVEIVFDNSDNRIPIDHEEVSIRRMVGAKKDSYYMDKKHVTKNDIMNLLESAGFSRSNPYYIVKQGKINQLAVAPDSQRLKLLREVAGTRVYDERKEESSVIIKETETKQAKIDEMLTYIEERLTNLEEEKEELREYQTLDKMRRSLEYTIHDKEIKDTRDKLESMDGARERDKHESKALHDSLCQTQAKIESLERELRSTSSQASGLLKERQQLQDELQEQIKRRAKVEFSVKDLEQNVEDDQSAKVQCEHELKELEKEVAAKQAELESVVPQYQQQKRTEERLTARLKACEQRRSELFAKQGRVQQFSSKEKRDRWIEKELQSLQQSAQQKEQQIEQVREDIAQLKAKVHKQEQDIQDYTSSMEQQKATLDRVNREYAELKMKRDELTHQRKELWRTEAKVDQTIQDTRIELTKYERHLRGSMGKAISNGLDSVKRIVEERQLSGVYGPVIDNFSCAENMFTAVEVTAGNRLFHVIVDSDQTASQILEIMNRKKMPGEVTFLPLNKLRTPPVNYPDHTDAMPMIDQLQYDPMYRPAFCQVFGRTLVCRDIEKASYFSKSADMDCITPDGDQVSRRGALTGGYYDTRRSRLEQQKMIRKIRTTLEQAEGEKSSLKRQLDDLDGHCTQLFSDVERAETKLIQLREGLNRHKIELRNVSSEHQTHKHQLEPKERLLSTQQEEYEAVCNSITSLQAELGTDLLSQLDPRDQREVEHFGEEIQSLQHDLRKCLSHRSQLEMQKNTLENQLHGNLLRRTEQLRQDLEEMSLTNTHQDLELQQEEFKRLCFTIDQTKARLDEVESTVDEHTKKTKELNAALDQWKSVERDQQESVNDEAKAKEKLANKRSLLLKKKEETMRKIRDLGSLPSGTFDKYQGLPLSQLWKKLQHCNTELKKYSHVNKKALDQFQTFSEEKDRLTSRKEELDRAYQSIQGLMEVLERKKHEAIQFTFKQVSKNFSEVFKELVPCGHAELVMKRTIEEAPRSAESSEELSQSSPPMEEFTGVSIQVSFTGQTSEMKELQQLSGGQKSLVALGLIFSIQKCDPAPFYLFDEIDQALDPHHRNAVAALLHRLSGNAQFITTTFRPELLEVADKCYGVRFRNRVSYIDAVSKEDARDFIEHDAAEQ